MRDPKPGAAHAAVKRELLVRYLDTATPTLLHHAKRVTYAEGYAVAPRQGHGEVSAVAALRVFGEFPDLLAKRHLTMVLVGADLAGLRARMDTVRAETGAAPTLRVELEAGRCDERLVPSLTAVDAFAGPIVAYLDAAGAEAPSYDTVAAIGAAPDSEVLIALDPTALLDPARAEQVFGAARWRDAPRKPDARYAYLVGCYRDALRLAGFGRLAHAELVDDAGRAQLLLFATASEKSLDRFKDALWAVDEFAGVRYRDPRDDAHALLDISLRPHLGPLRRALLTRVRADGECSVGDLRQHTRTETIYRVPDATRAIGELVATGALAREPERGRLSTDTRLRSP